GRKQHRASRRAERGLGATRFESAPLADPTARCSSWRARATDTCPAGGPDPAGRCRAAQDTSGVAPSPSGSGGHVGRRAITERPITERRRVGVAELVVGVRLVLELGVAEGHLEGTATAEIA